MTPLHITMLLHYHTTPTPYAEHDCAHQESEAVHKFRAQLVKLELIERDEADVSLYHTTDKGRAFVDMLCATPMPIQKWSAP